METNTCAKPSVGGKSAVETAKRKQSVHPAVIASVNDEGRTKHSPAEIQDMRQQVSDYINQFEVNLKDREGRLVKSSHDRCRNGREQNKEGSETV